MRLKSVGIGLVLGAILITGCATTPPRPTNVVDTFDNPPPLKLASVRSIQMLNAKDGWSIAIDGVYQTANGGVGWVDAGPTEVPNNAIGNCYFTNSLQGWVVSESGDETGAVVANTQNGGHTWHAITFDKSQPLQSNFISGSEGWIALAQGAAMMHEKLTILHTQDSGAHWVTVAQTTTSDKPGSLPFLGDKSGVYFLNTQIGWVSGYSPAEGEIYLYKTIDGGHTWSPQHLRVLPEYAHTQLSCRPPQFFSAKDGVLPVYVYQGNGEVMIIYRTTDGGKTWTPLSPLVSTSSNLVADFVNSSLAFVSSGAQILVTHDGGQSWGVTPTIFSVNTVQQLDFISSQIGWAVVNGQLYKTLDGGHHWIHL